TRQIASPSSARPASISANASVSPSVWPDAGSSSRRMRGEVISARATSTTRARPMGMSDTSRSAMSVRPVRSRILSVSSSRSRRLRPLLRRMSPATRTLSRTVSDRNSSSRWNVRAMPRRARLAGDSPVMSSPSRNTRPDAGFSKPVMVLNIVVLPAPFGPMSPVMRPSSMVRLTSSTAVLPPNRTVMPLVSSRVPAACVLLSGLSGAEVSDTGPSLLQGRGQAELPVEPRPQLVGVGLVHADQLQRGRAGTPLPVPARLGEVHAPEDGDEHDRAQRDDRERPGPDHAGQREDVQGRAERPRPVQDGLGPAGRPVALDEVVHE